MGIYHRERLVFFAQVQKHRNQSGVFQHIGEVSGVIGVPIVHARCRAQKPEIRSLNSEISGTVL
jgi:hypothetical protein